MAGWFGSVRCSPLWPPLSATRDIRSVELAWGAAIAAEWYASSPSAFAAYEQAARPASGSLTSFACCRRRWSPPFAASFGDRFPRERFLLVMTLLSSAALAGSAVAFYADLDVIVAAFTAVLEPRGTLIRPACADLLPSLARTPAELIASNAATSLIGLGTLLSPGRHGRARLAGRRRDRVCERRRVVVLGATSLDRRRGEAALPLAADERGARQMVAAVSTMRDPGARLVVVSSSPRPSFAAASTS